MKTIADCLGSLRHCAQFFVWKLDNWNGKKYKTKGPWAGHRIAHNKPENWLTLEAALAALERYRQDGGVYTLGLWLTPELGTFFFDLDGFPERYVLTPDAQARIEQFPGAFVEWSSSGHGIHIIGKHTGVPKHAPSNPNVHAYELYEQGRGIAFGLTGQAQGDADAVFDLGPLVQELFPVKPTVKLVGSNTPGDMRATIKLGEFVQSILDAPEGQRNQTLNTASYTMGGYVGAARIERATVVKALYDACVQAQWSDIDKCLRTIEGGVASGINEPLVTSTIVVVPQAPEVVTDVGRDLIAMVQECMSLEDMYGRVVPHLCSIDLGIYKERLVDEVTARFELLGAKQRKPIVRAMLTPQRVAAADVGQAPAWVHEFVYVTSKSIFYSTVTGEELSRVDFDVKFNRNMPLKQNGDREQASKWAAERWGIVTVDDIAYRPDQPALFSHSARDYVNSFVPASVTKEEDYTTEGVAMIERFQNHMLLLCNNRHEVFNQLLLWLAHNVQHPGVKIRWSPLIKGIPGDGKGLIFSVLRAGLGFRNVNVTSISTLSNNGGFTDWAEGYACNIIEEIHLTGKERHKLFNAMKGFITDDVMNVNSKGGRNKGASVNVTNHGATTNFNDAIPVDDYDRRWFIVFTPYAHILEAARAHGVSSEMEYVKHLGEIGDAMKKWPGQFRRWLMSIDTSQFNPNGRAMMTPEKSRMGATSTDPLEDEIRDVLLAGGNGIHVDAFSSKRLQGQLKIRELSGGMPATTAWHHLLSRMGYEKFEQQLWWDGQNHRIWAKPGIVENVDAIKAILDSTR